jgi:hypothetical protein
MITFTELKMISAGHSLNLIDISLAPGQSMPITPTITITNEGLGNYTLTRTLNSSEKIQTIQFTSKDETLTCINHSEIGFNDRNVFVKSF